MRYPRQQASVVALADQMINGIAEHSDIFTHCDSAILQTARDEFAQASDDLLEAQGQVTVAAAAKLEKFNKLQAEMKRQLKLGTVDTADNPTELSYIGWGPRREPQSIEPPSQPKNLKIIAEGDGMVFLFWDKSKGAGPVNCYIVERREFTEGGKSDWQSATATLNNQYKLTDQPTGCKLEYRVKAINKSGQSMPSNMVCVGL